MDLQSRLEEHERKKRRITLIGLGIIAVLLVAVIVAGYAKNKPYEELQQVWEERRIYHSQLSDAKDALAEKESRLTELEESIAETKTLLDERKAALEQAEKEGGLS